MAEVNPQAFYDIATISVVKSFIYIASITYICKERFSNLLTGLIIFAGKWQINVMTRLEPTRVRVEPFAKLH